MFNKNASKSAIRNIVTIDAYGGKYYQFKDDIFEELEKPTYNLSNFLTSYVSNKDFITSTVSISRSVPEEDIDDILEIKAYEELGLDQAKEYIVQHYESKNDNSGEREFHLFVIEPIILEGYFLPIKQQTKYIDLIIPIPLLFKALYTKDILPENGTHSFVYFAHSDAFIVIYHRGEYLYSKTIEYNLTRIYDNYCELVGEKIPENEFFRLLEQEGLKSANETYQKNLMRIFGEVFININDIIIYAKRAFEIDMIDKMFLGSVSGPIIGLDDYSQNYLGLTSVEFNLQYRIQNNTWYIDQLHYLMLLNSFEYLENPYNFINFTNFPRPPAFVNRASGQFLISAFATISLSVAYPVMNLVGTYLNEAKTFALNLQNEDASKEAEKFKKTLGEKKKELDRLDGEIKQMSVQYNAKTKTLIAIYDKKINYRLKSGILHMVADELLKFGVHIEELKTDNDTIWLSLVGTSDEKITEYIQYVTETHYKELKIVDIKLIKKDPDTEYYRGILKVDLR